MTPAAALETSKSVAPPTGFTAQLKAKAERTTERLVDPWLPKAGRPIDWRQFLGGLLFLPVLVALRGFSGYLSSYCMAWVSERVVNDLRGDVLAKLSSLSLDFFNRSTTGDLYTGVSGDTSQLQKCLSLSGDLVKEPVTLIGLFFGLLLLDWQLTLAAMLFCACVRGSHSSSRAKSPESQHARLGFQHFSIQFVGGSDLGHPGHQGVRAGIHVGAALSQFVEAHPALPDENRPGGRTDQSHH
jgi:ABC-type multidrug transport system fused ATPase/permease subunit